MIESIINITVLLIFLGIPYSLLSYLAFRLYKKKKYWRSSTIVIILLPAIIIPGIYLGYLPGSDIYWDSVITSHLTGQKFRLNEPLYQYDSERDFHGDGYSITVYQFDNEVKINKEKLKNFPQKQSVRKHWEVKEWQLTPFNDNENAFLEFALMENNPNPALIAAKNLVRKYIKESGHYYSYLYYMHRDRPGNIDFYLLNVKDKILISINHNT